MWFNNSGSFNFAQNELYQKALKALFKLKSDFLVHNRPSVHPSVLPSFRSSKIFFVAFFSVTVDGRNLIFGHKRHTKKVRQT
jgi:hypothetical protein